MRRCVTHAFLVFLGIASVNASHAQGARLYKWVDEHGNVHYSDRVEGTSAQHGPQTINSNGIQIGTDTDQRARSREQLQQEREARRSAQLDTMLLANYSNEVELLRAHDESRAAIEAGIRALEESLMRIRRQLAERELRHDVAPNDANVARLKQQLIDEEANLERMRARRFELYERQNQEIARFRELTMNNG